MPQNTPRNISPYNASFNLPSEKSEKDSLPGRIKQSPFITVERDFLSSITKDEALIQIIRAHLRQLSATPP